LIALLGPEQSPQESMDSLLNAAFYQALKTSASAKKIEFPILTSNFFRQCTVTNKRLLKILYRIHLKLQNIDAVIGMREISKLRYANTFYMFKIVCQKATTFYVGTLPM
jgi:hypothetical protein